MTEQRSAHTKRFRRAGIIVLAASGLLLILGVSLARPDLLWSYLAFPLAGGGIVLGADLYWRRSDPIYDRSRFEPGGDLYIAPMEHEPGS